MKQEFDSEISREKSAACDANMEATRVMVEKQSKDMVRGVLRNVYIDRIKKKLGMAREGG